jgi:crotonobetainyl-CoA:carnitine CoA-transferase CaiB-like acyl-CoA transferase
MPKPLEGIRVLEWAIFHAGPGATAILRDMGAEVIKIEQPVSGDPIRRAWHYKAIDFKLANGFNTFYEGANRGKKGITLNLAHPEGRKIAYRLVQKCDVFLTNLRTSTVRKMELDYEHLAKVNPLLIYAAVTGYGKQGPDCDLGGFDYQGQGRSGMMYAMGEPDMPPVISQFALIDQTTAIMASYQVLIALFMRERLGIGQEVDTSLLGTASYMMYCNYLAGLLKGCEIPRHDQQDADPLRNYYRCQDGKWLIVTPPPSSEEDWAKICLLLGHPELVVDPRFNDREKRFTNSRELVAIFIQAFAGRPQKEWLRLASEKNLVVCPVNSLMEALQDPQIIANKYVVDFQHPKLGPIKIPGFPIHLSQGEMTYSMVAPGLGQDTESVLKEIGGYSPEEVARFKREKIT